MQPEAILALPVSYLGMSRRVRNLPMIVNKRESNSHVRFEPVIDGVGERRRPNVFTSDQYYSHCLNSLIC